MVAGIDCGTQGTKAVALDAAKTADPIAERKDACDEAFGRDRQAVLDTYQTDVLGGSD